MTLPLSKDMQTNEIIGLNRNRNGYIDLLFISSDDMVGIGADDIGCADHIKCDKCSILNTDNIELCCTLIEMYTDGHITNNQVTELLNTVGKNITLTFEERLTLQGNL